MTSIFVCNLPPQFDLADAYSLFSNFGVIIRVRNYGECIHIVYQFENDAFDAIDMLDGQVVNHYLISVTLGN